MSVCRTVLLLSALAAVRHLHHMPPSHDSGIHIAIIYKMAKNAEVGISQLARDALQR